MESITQLIEREQLPHDFVTNVLPHYQQLANYLQQQSAAHDGCLRIAINGAQGTGKSTFAMMLQALLAEQHLNTVVISIDDLYLTRHQRGVLAAEVHPLFQTRGVPGTHDLALGQQLIDQLILPQAKRSKPVAIPRFDKAADDRVEASAWTQITGQVDIILLEGWCVGATAMSDASLAQPINALEKREDPDSVWRNYQNRMLANSYHRFFAQFDRLVMLKAPSFDQVKQWRALQEHKLRQRQATSQSARAATSSAQGRGIMDDDALERFMMHYERLTLHMLKEMPSRADAVIVLNADHNVTHVMYA